jgi:hypothetical protein
MAIIRWWLDTNEKRLLRYALTKTNNVLFDKKVNRILNSKALELNEFMNLRNKQTLERLDVRPKDDQESRTYLQYDAKPREPVEVRQSMFANCFAHVVTEYELELIKSGRLIGQNSAGLGWMA